VKTPPFPVSGVRIISGVRAAPSMGDHQARRTMDAVVVVKRIRAAKKVDHPAHVPPPPEFL